MGESTYNLAERVLRLLEAEGIYEVQIISARAPDPQADRIYYTRTGREATFDGEILKRLAAIAAETGTILSVGQADDAGIRAIFFPPA